MNTPLICTFIGKDKPGLVSSLAASIKQHQGNWLESSMAQLAGYFAGIVRIDVNANNRDALIQSLHALDAEGLRVRVADDSSTHNQSRQPISHGHHKLQIVGNDRPGIVHEITQALSSNAINVLEMATHLSSAAMSGDPLFNATMLLAVPPATDLDLLSSQLDAIATALAIEIDLIDDQ